MQELIHQLGIYASDTGTTLFVTCPSIECAHRFNLGIRDRQIQLEKTIVIVVNDGKTGLYGTLMAQQSIQRPATDLK